MPERTSKEQAKYPPMPKLVLYGIAKQFLGTVLDIEVDQSGQTQAESWLTSSWAEKAWRPSTSREPLPEMERWMMVTWSLLTSWQDLGQPWTSSRALEQGEVTLLISTEYFINY